MLHQNRCSCQKHITLGNNNSNKKYKNTQTKSSRPSFQKETTKNSHQFFRDTRISVPSDLQGVAASLLSGHQASMSFQSFFLHVNKSHISKKTEWTHGSGHYGEICIYSMNFWTCSINILPQQTPALCFAAYLRFAVKQWDCVIHYLRYDILFASPDCPWQVDSPYTLFWLPNEIKIDFILLILGSSNPQVGVSKCLPHTSPRNNTVLAQMLMKNRERGVHLQLKWDYLEKLPKYLWINFPISNVIPAAEVYGKQVHLSPAGLEHSHFHLRTFYHNFWSISKHHPGQCERYGKDHRSSSRRLHLIHGAVEAVKKQYRMWHLAVHDEWIGTVARVLEKVANLWRHYVSPSWGLCSSSVWKRWVPWGGPVLVWEEG